MKKILAVLLALTVVFAFAACGAKEPEEPTTEVETEALTEAVQEETTEAAEPESEAVPEAEEETTAEETTDEEKPAGLNSTDKEEIAAYYNAAIIKTNEVGKVKSKQTMSLRKGSLTGDGAIGAIAKVVEPVAIKALAKNSIDLDYVPGQGRLKASDIKSASAVSKDGKTTITMTLYDQVDGFNADPSDGGAASRGIGTMGSAQIAVDEMGAEVVSGADTVKLTYNNCSVKVVIDEKTGTVTDGTWQDVVNVYIGEAKAKLGLTATLKNFGAVVDYKVVTR